MAERKSGWTQNSGPTGTMDVEATRLVTGALLYTGSTNVRAKTGFRPGPGTSPGLVTATGTPDGFVHVAPFQLFYQGARGSVPGAYTATLDAQKDINILSTPADPTNPRDDLIIAQQSDTFYGDGNSDFIVKQVVGTPAGVPTDPTITGSADHVTLARVRVAANATTITSGNITDLRTSGHAKSLTGGLYAVALGAILPVASSAQRDALTGNYNGLPVWRSDINAFQVNTPGAGFLSFDTQSTPFTPAWTGTGSNPAIGNGVITAAYWLRGRTCHYVGKITMGSTTTFGSGSWLISAPVNLVSTDQSTGILYCDDTSTSANNRAGALTGSSASTFALQVLSNVTPTSPFTWAVGDSFRWHVSYETA